MYNYTNGKENGVQRYYYPSGQLKTEWNMAMGQWDGKYTRWYANGKIEEEGNYKAGFPSGLWREYHEDGSLSRTKATSGPDDTIINYYPNGKIKNRTYYKGHERHGDYFVYDTLGKVQTYKHFTKGRQDSVQVSYYPSGKKSEQIRFKGKKEEGSYEGWYPNGKLKLAGQHINGDPVGEWKKYDETGKFQPLHYSKVGRETRAFNSSDYDENDPPEAVEEMISIPLEFTRPVVTNADRPVTVLRSDKLKFLKNYSSIDALAVMDTHGKVIFRVVTPLEPAQKEKLENYLNAHFSNGKPMTFSWDKIVEPCTMTVKIVVSGQ
jgi:antitoxin component YwqK of YwqJK toxin-antitoxin module